MGFEILPFFQRKGIISEALEAVINFAFNDIGLTSIEGEVHRKNFKSIRLLEKFKFRIKPGGTNDPDMIIYRLLK